MNYRGLVRDPQVGMLVWTGRGVGRITEYDASLEMFYVEYENGAHPAWFGREKLRNITLEDKIGKRNNNGFWL